jgi:cytochrome b561
MLDDMNALPRYTRPARWFHWLMATLIVLAYVLIKSRTEFGRGTDLRLMVVQSHYWVGITILILAFPRLFYRAGNRPPAITPPLEGVIKQLAALTHFLLYAFLFVQPILGLTTVLLDKGVLPIPFTDLVIHSPFAVSRASAHFVEHIHRLVGKTFYYVIGLHVLAALFHHCIRKDNTLKRIV